MNQKLLAERRTSAKAKKKNGGSTYKAGDRDELIEAAMSQVTDADVFGPTQHVPGSPEKIATMIQRRVAGVEVDHPDDVKHRDHEPLPVLVNPTEADRGVAVAEDEGEDDGDNDSM